MCAVLGLTCSRYFFVFIQIKHNNMCRMPLLKDTIYKNARGMNRFVLSSFLLLSVLVLGSCRSVKDAIYFDGYGSVDSLTVMDIIQDKTEYAPLIEPDDELSIIVSAENVATVAPFNLPAINVKDSQTVDLVASGQLQTYIVDSDGEITFPVFGRVKIAGMTRKEAEDCLQGLISQYVINPIVTINILNSKISVIGEVNSPGPKPLTSERLTILDAIALAGDLTIQGNRTNVLLIREDDGKRNFYRIDLTTPDIFTKPYYYVKKNDIIYVEPNKERQQMARYNSQKQTNISIISTTLSGISIISSLIMAFSLK